MGEGKYNLSLVILENSVQKVQDIIERITEEFSDELDNIYVSFASKIYHFPHNYLYSIKNTKQIIIGESQKKIELDRLDLALCKDFFSRACE